MSLSLLALAVPVAGAWLFPESVVEEVGVLLWLTALVPPFLLTYYRGWLGASAGLAGGMAALTLAHLVVVWGELASPNWSLVAGTVVLYMGVCIGVGVLGEVLRRERKMAEDRALTDPLTGLPNRRHAGIVLDTAFAAAVRGQPLAVIFFDVDHFKAFNDNYGHAAGDKVLRILGSVLESCTRRMDLSARYGGEEFLSILSNCTVDGALLFTRRVREELSQADLPWGPVTVSAGVALHDDSMGSPEVLVAAADRALYAAKEDGRDRIRVVGPEGRPVSPEVLQEAEGLEEAPSSSPAPDPTRRRGTGGSRRHRPLFPLGPRDASAPPVFQEDPSPAATGSGDSSTKEGERERVPRVLVVEDDDGARTAVVRVLDRLGYEILEAPGPVAALRLFREAEGEVDLVLTDVMMPEMSGVTMVGRMVDQRPGLRAIYMSGYVQGEVAWRGAPGAVTAFLEKPMTVETLAKEVERVLSAAPTDPEGALTSTGPARGRTGSEAHPPPGPG